MNGVGDPGDPGGGVGESLDRVLEVFRRYFTGASGYLPEDLVVAGKPLPLLLQSSDYI